MKTGMALYGTYRVVKKAVKAGKKGIDKLRGKNKNKNKDKDTPPPAGAAPQRRRQLVVRRRHPPHPRIYQPYFHSRRHRHAPLFPRVD